MNSALPIAYSNGLRSNVFSDFFSKFSIQDITNLLTMSKSWQEKFTQRTIPDYIQNQDLNSSFFINFYGNELILTSLVFLFIIFGVFELFAGICIKQDKRRNRDKTLFHHLRVIAFNTVLVQLASKSGDIILYFWIEVDSPQPDGVPKTNWDNISLITAVAMISLVGIIVFVAYYILLRKSQKKISQKKFPKFAQSWKNYQIVFSGIKNDESLFIKFFYLFYLTLGIISSIFDIFQKEIPRINAFIQIAISLFTLFILIVEKPLRSRLNLIQLVMIELSDIALVITQFFVPDDTFTTISSWRNICISAFLLIFLFIKLKREIEVIRRYKTLRPQVSKTIWLQVLVPIIQQLLGFGFEHFKLSHFYVKSKLGYEKSINDAQIENLYDPTDSD